MIIRRPLSLSRLLFLESLTCTIFRINIVRYIKIYLSSLLNVINDDRSSALKQRSFFRHSFSLPSFYFA